MKLKSRRGRLAGTWSAVTAVVVVALTGPAAADVPVLAAMGAPATSMAAADLPVPPLPVPPIPVPGQTYRERSAASKQKLDNHWGKVPSDIVSWGVNDSGKLMVEVAGNNSAAAMGFLLLAGADPTTAAIKTGVERPRKFAELVGGDAIYGTSVRCSLGFNAKTSSGKRYVLTAGHCTRANSGYWSGYNRERIGAVAASRFPTDDFGVIAVSNSSWTSTAKVKGGPIVKGSTVASIGSQVCRSGSTTGYRCGVVQAYNQTVNYGGGDVVMGLTRTTACAEGGDSGGSFITPAGQAQGLTSGGSGNCTVGGVTYFQPVNEALSRYGLALYKG